MKHRLVIERAKWACYNYDRDFEVDDNGDDNPLYVGGPTGHGDAELLNEQGAMCCLGFAMAQAGLPAESYLYTGTPEGIPLLVLQEAPNKEFLELFVKDNDDGIGWSDTTFCNDAVGINDDPRLGVEEREQKLIKLFAKNDVELVFV